MKYDELLYWLSTIYSKRVYRSKYFSLGAIECSRLGGHITEKEADQLKRYFECWDM